MIDHFRQTRHFARGFRGSGRVSGYLLLFFLCMSCIAQGQGLMQKGIKVPLATKRHLSASLEPLSEALAWLQQSQDPFIQRHEPDVAIYHKAVQVALEENIFYSEKQFDVAERLIETGLARAAHLLNGKAPWTRQTGRVVRGYRSRLDDSVQPYGLEVPSTWKPDRSGPYRLDVWLHGRDNRLSELKFIDQRERSSGPFVPDRAFVLHPYGRFCNAFKFAGEVDVFEAMAHVREQYPIDEDRLAIRGFSMGGAGCWHLAVHHADQWAAAAPGAGFAESADYLGLWKKDPLPTWFETKLWRLYDADAYALNLFHLPTVAYSGGDDKQIQAARMMEKALAQEGMHLKHVIGPDTGHRYHPESRQEIADRVDGIVSYGRVQTPRKIRMTTYTLKYPDMHWVRLEGLEQHWEKAVVVAELEGSDRVRVATQNVRELTLQMVSGECPLDPGVTAVIEIDGQTLSGPRVQTDRSWRVPLRKENGRWSIRENDPPGHLLRKRPGLQGPIDDAFMDRFVIVKPSGRQRRSLSDRWMRREQVRLENEWRAQFRGEPLSASDQAFDREAWKDAHWVLFGTPESNAVIKQLMPYLPFQWPSGEVRFGAHSFDDKRYVPVMIFPNPMFPDKYIVLNSGFTFRGYGSNATQIPRLPDYAVIDTRVRPSTEVPGGIALAGFFDEAWQLDYD